MFVLWQDGEGNREKVEGIGLKELQNVPQMVIVDPLFINAGDTRYKVSLKDGYSIIRGLTIGYRVAI